MESTDDGLITFDNKMWFKRISSEEAFRIRFDVQLYYINVDGNLEIDWATPIIYRKRWEEGLQEGARMDDPYVYENTWWWRGHTFYVAVDDPNKEEYVCPS